MLSGNRQPARRSIKASGARRAVGLGSATIAGVEHVMGFCTPQEYDRFLRRCPTFEDRLIPSGGHVRPPRELARPVPDHAATLLDEA